MTSDFSEKWDLDGLPKVQPRGYAVEDSQEGLDQFKDSGDANGGGYKFGCDWRPGVCSSPAPPATPQPPLH